MTRPVVTPTTEEAYEALLHLTAGDEQADWTLLRFTDGLLRQLDAVNVLVRDDEQFVGWGRILDIDEVPRPAIWWLGQFIGVTPLTGLDEASQRLRVEEADGWKRGSVSAVRGAARQLLVGERLVALEERTKADGSYDPYHARLTTFQANTPDAAAVEQAIRALTPAGILIHHRVLEIVSYDQFAGDWATYNAAKTRFASYNAAREYVPTGV